MSLSFALRASLALAVGLFLGIAGLIAAGGREDSQSFGEDDAAQQHKSFRPRLTLIRQASNGELVSLQIAPFEAGSNNFRMALLDPLGRIRKLEAAGVRFSRLESPGVVAEVESAPAGQSRESTFVLPEPGWWQVDVSLPGGSVASFHLKLDQPSSAPNTFPPPTYESDVEARRVFEAAVARYSSLSGLQWREELTTGQAGENPLGVWFITDIDANVRGLHARTLSLDGASELYSGKERQCFRQARDAWKCTAGPAPVGPLDLAYLQNATGFAKGRTDIIDGEMTQVIFFYSPSQRAWYAWWVGIESNLLRQQVMIASGHFMLDHYSLHDAAISIDPGDLPPN